MIKITYGQIRNPNFAQALWKLNNFEGFEPKVAYNFARVFDKIQQFERKANEVMTKKRDELRDQYAKKNEDGTVYEPQGPGSFEVAEEHREVAETWFDDVDKIEEEIQRHKLSIDDAKAVKLAPKDLIALEPILDGLDDFDKPANTPDLKSV